MPKTPLETLEEKFQVIRDRVTGVAKRIHEGLYVWGEGGTGKSFTVEKAIDATGRLYKLTNSRLTAKGLFETLHEFPDHIHVLEDVEILFRDKHAAGVLRAATWGPTNEQGIRERTVTWTIGGSRESFLFTGGLIVIANMPIQNLPELRAVATRLGPLHFDPNDDELAALMRVICGDGFRHGDLSLTPEECSEVGDEIIERFIRVQRRLDLRLLIHGFGDRLQDKIGASKSDWTVLLESRMYQRVVSNGGVQDETRAHHFEVLKSLKGLSYPERVAKWAEITGKSKSTFDRRVREFRKEFRCHIFDESDTTTPAHPIEPFGLYRRDPQRRSSC